MYDDSLIDDGFLGGKRAQAAKQLRKGVVDTDYDQNALSIGEADVVVPVSVVESAYNTANEYILNQQDRHYEPIAAQIGESPPR